ncbi:MAG TPA: phosphatidylserine decarboxylase [Thermoplasmatales archaeon]|nr:phosphatidylserine decarboxylase [Thermoplasmatales archaeon]HEX17723.1 phosphatidylserine decarboxylase [Thermoplasmatales archaeon]
MIAEGGKGIISSMFLLGSFILILSIIIPSLLILFVLILILTIFVMIFFRDPERRVGEGIVSPADGRIIDINEIDDPDVGESIKISIFMNLFDVHVNRMPLDGRILRIERTKGSFLPAFLKNADKNERNTILAETEIGKVKIVQIAGMLARRIVCYIREGDFLRKGERIGMIRFGSRVDLILPRREVKIRVRKKDRVKAGADGIAEIHG